MRHQWTGTAYGARPLAEMILAGRVKEGDQVKIAAGPRGLMFNGKAAQTAEAA